MPLHGVCENNDAIKMQHEAGGYILKGLDLGHEDMLTFIYARDYTSGRAKANQRLAVCGVLLSAQ